MVSEGPYSGTSENIDRDAKQEWTNPTNADIQNDSYANIDVTGKNYTDWLRTLDFGFNIPVDATINGILVEIDHYGEGGNIDESSVRLVLGGVIQGEEKANGATIPDVDTDTYMSYGGSGDNWNAILDYADINNATFGIQISYWNDHNVQARNVYVDHIRMTVYYTVDGVGSNPKRAIGKQIGSGIL